MSKQTIVVDGETYEKVSKALNVHFILDDSASMKSVHDATISGFNEYLSTLKNDGNDYRLTLSEFSGDVKTVYEARSIKDVKRLSKETYPANGWRTALYDSAMDVLKPLKNAKGQHIVVIMTDGQDNASTRYNMDDLKRLKDQLDKTDRWTFVFLGANQDAWATARGFGFAPQNVSSYNHTNVGTKAAFRNVAASTTDMMSLGGFTTQEFFTKGQIKDIEQSV